MHICQEINTGFIWRDKIEKRGRDGDTWNANTEKWKSAKNQLVCPNKDNVIFSSKKNTLKRGGSSSSIHSGLSLKKKKIKFQERTTQENKAEQWVKARCGSLQTSSSQSKAWVGRTESVPSGEKTHGKPFSDELCCNAASLKSRGKAGKIKPSFGSCNSYSLITWGHTDLVVQQMDSSPDRCTGFNG